MNSTLRIFVSVLFLGLASHSKGEENQLAAINDKLISYDQETCDSQNCNYAEPLVMYKKGKFSGLTDHGLNTLKKARDILRKRFELFNRDFFDLESVCHAIHVARLAKGNIFIYGPPGGAKSAVVDWVMRGEKEEGFQLQLNQMMTEQVFVGGQDYEAAKKGIVKFNTEGSLAHYTVGLIDEVEKGNPAALSALMSLLNERKVLLGNKVVAAKLETLFATSNANLPEVIQLFTENGQGSTGPALFNRFQFKVFMYNWLSAKNRSDLLNLMQKRLDLQMEAYANPEILNDHELFSTHEPLDWEALRQLAFTLFKPSSLFNASYIKFTEDMRTRTIKAIQESEERFREQPEIEIFVYFPSADYSIRLTQQIPKIVYLSAFIDFLLSPLADDQNLQNSTQKSIYLDPSSLWRAYLVMTTIGPGHTKFEIKDQKFEVNFNWSLDSYLARDDREAYLMKNLKFEQMRFMQSLRTVLENNQSAIKTKSQYSSGVGQKDETDGDMFELLLINSQGD